MDIFYLAGFDEISPSSSVFKSPSEVPLSYIGSGKETAVRDDVFSQGEDEDILRDYEAVHGLLPTNDDEQSK